VETFAADDEIDVTVLLVGERPEEIREWRAATTAEVIATPFDESAARHMQVTDIVFERARRMVERGDDVVLIIESLSRMLRFSLSDLPGSGREIRGVDASSLHRIRRYMASARALEEGGSLTIIGVVSGDPGNRTDRVLLEDLQEVVNWELVLDRHLADRGFHPPVNVSQSGTRREERLLEPHEITERRTLRAAWTGDPVQDASLLVSAATSRPTSLDNAAGSGQ
jgi:transcription termination factor Rho